MGKSNREMDDMRSIRAAIKKVKDGKYEEALQFLENAQRRRSENSELIQELIDDLRKIVNDEQHTKKFQSDKFKAPKKEKVELHFTESQNLLVQEIKTRKSFYNILNVKRDATFEEIKRSYKRLLLQLHPDKNSAPDAPIAFQMVSNAFAVLSDERKRKLYDAAEACGTTINDFGKSKPQVSTPIPRDCKRSLSSMTLDMLFGKTARIFNITTTRTLLGSLLVAIILAFGTAILSQSNQIFSFKETSKFNVHQVTQRLRIPYYVRTNFQETFKGDLTKLENDIEQQYITIIDMNCRNERHERENAMARARQAGSHWEYARIYSIRLKSCDVLTRLGLDKKPNDDFIV